MRDWPACVAHAKNNFICVSIVKRDKRMRDAGRCAGRYPRGGASACVSVLTTSVPILVGRGARI
jgi:hypothetical protein